MTRRAPRTRAPDGAAARRLREARAALAQVCRAGTRRLSFPACLGEVPRPRSTRMSVQSVRDFFASRNLDIPIIELDVSTATVALAAQAHGVESGRIAKTLSFRLNDGRVIILVARGDARIDNRKFRAAFGKGRMLPPEEVAALTGHPVGGLCPFGLAQPLPIYLDRSLHAFDEVLPAGGAIHTAVRISPARLAQVTAGEWVDVCRLEAPSPGA
jgi:prolyl-tRNA editing enzyme YbaK/EbsC (Cys-tRNA(Pro) deacylase)